MSQIFNTDALDGPWSGLIEVKLILTTLTTRGKGVEGDPCRRIVQLWTHDGKLVAERDDFEEANP